MDITPPDPTEPPKPDPYEPPRTPDIRPARRRRGPFAILGVGVGICLVIISSLIAFVVTCFPVGLMTLGGNAEGVEGTAFQRNFPWFVGIAAGLLAGAITTRLVFRTKRRSDPTAPPNEAKPR